MDDGARTASARRVIGRTLGVLIVAAGVLAGLYAYRLQFVAPRHRPPRRGGDRARGVLSVAAGVLAGLYAYRLQFVQPRTDDAAVRANVVGIAPQVSGPIVDLHVVDNQHVKAGDLLFAIDCRPYEARLARASADLALAVKE